MATEKRLSLAAMTSAGALRLGQWPVASNIIILLPGIMRRTKSPTSIEAIISSLH